MKRHSSIAAALGLVAASLGVALIGPVHAADSSVAQTSGCPAKHYCFFHDANFQGGEVKSPGERGKLKPRDKVSSVINNSGLKVCLYDDNAWPGTKSDLILTVPAYKDVHYVGNRANDKADGWLHVKNNKTCPQQVGKWWS